MQTNRKRSIMLSICHGTIVCIVCTPIIWLHTDTSDTYRETTATCINYACHWHWPDVVKSATHRRCRCVWTRNIAVTVCRHSGCWRTYRTKAELAFSQSCVAEIPASTLIHTYWWIHDVSIISTGRHKEHTRAFALRIAAPVSTWHTTERLFHHLRHAYLASAN